MKTMTTLKGLIGAAMAVASMVGGSMAQAQTTYEIYVGGTQVTSTNAADITGSWKKGGSVSYDDATKTLTLTNAVIESGDVQGIKSALDSLNVKLVGINTITTTYASSVYNDMNGKMFITGDTLKAMCTQQSAMFSSYFSTLCIRDCYVEAEGMWGITGVTGFRDEVLKIDHARVKATGTSFGSIQSFSQFLLSNCHITMPTGAAWNEEYHAVCTGSDMVMNQAVVIMPDEPTGIALPHAENATVKAIYDTTGRRLNEMRPGVNIVLYNDGSTRKIWVRQQ